MPLESRRSSWEKSRAERRSEDRWAGNWRGHGKEGGCREHRSMGSKAGSIEGTGSIDSIDSIASKQSTVQQSNKQNE